MSMILTNTMKPKKLDILHVRSVRGQTMRIRYAYKINAVDKTYSPIEVNVKGAMIIRLQLKNLATLNVPDVIIQYVLIWYL